ncbi:hypothetical protein B0A49_08122 [Cryomyces minteri]|uniref:Amino acid permease/ SLC12A domain-containing protein n=1 Tax=Cryomyces minteri TaxID=331657 RepID=A0A4U0X0Q9_9PEZI|nr:hypothetical protein B0A49_08122 [Cryomyces minteri]
MHGHADDKTQHPGKPKPGSFPRPVGGSAKLGTFAGVFVPTSLNVLSILMFLRFGFILGQSGVVGMMVMLIACYAINLVTTMSISAIASNGTVRGGGAYYLISRSLGPEFGGSIGIVFYLGFVFNTGMNAVGLIDCLKQNFGVETGNWANWLPEGFWLQYLWATVVLLACLSWETFKNNLMPHFTRGADGSQVHGKETYQDLFGILFPATGGIFAGASMSGDLKHPSKAIPKGTLYGLLLTFFAYAVVILAMAASISRTSFYHNVNVIQDVNVSGVLILLGECATSLFSSLMGVIGSAKLLQALARDHLLPGLSVFGQGTKGSDEPTYAIIVTYIVAQLTMLSDINQIASFVTMTYLMTFLVTNLACFLLKVSSAPNFRPSFHYFNWWTAAIGTIVSGATMFFVDGVYASACVGVLVVIFLIIHYTTPPKSWGDVSQSLIYHQVRKYLLRLRQEHVKFWRPQILLLVNDPRRQFKLIQFCNSLKKGALFVLGHVIVTQDFGGAVPEARRQQTAWTKYIDFSRVKAFVNIAISPAVEWGARNIVLSAGLGGMRPNIVVMGFFNLTEYRRTEPLIPIPSPQPCRSSTAASTQPSPNDLKKRRRSKDDKLKGQLPTDLNRPEGAVGVQSYVTILEDLLHRLQINVAIARGFQELEFPAHRPSKKERALSLLHLTQKDEEENTKKYIDLWPIQMSAEIAAEGGERRQNVLTTNFDTYTLILQLGCILHTVPAWKRAYKVRVAVFVEYESDVEEERGRVKTLLSNLRIEAEVLVFWLASGALKTYEIIVNGDNEGPNSEAVPDVDDALKDEGWWEDVEKIRGRKGGLSASQELVHVQGFVDAVQNWPSSSFQHGRRNSKLERFDELRKMLRRSRKHHSVSGLNRFGASLGMRTHRLHPDLLDRHASHGSASEDSGLDSDVFEGSESDGSNSDHGSAASENDIDEYMTDSDEGSSSPTPDPPLRSRSLSVGGAVQGWPRPSHHKSGFRHAAHGPRTAAASSSSFKRFDLASVRPDATASDSSHGGTSAPASDRRPTVTLNDDSERPSSATDLHQPSIRPPVMRQQSTPKFISKPMPRTQVASEDGPGPSIMFTDQPSPPTQQRLPHRSIYEHKRSPNSSGNTKADLNPFDSTQAQSASASGYPAQRAIPLSFNDLPCRAQHLILNELIQSASADTAVVFTTLPSPFEGTCENAEDSVRYLADLEVLCKDLPPVLLVHSNSMTVTMSL